MKKYRYTEAGGFPMFTPRRKERIIQRTMNWIGDHDIEILIVGMLIAVVYLAGIFMTATAQGIEILNDGYVGYMDEKQELIEDNYQMQQVLEALVIQRQEQN